MYWVEIKSNFPISIFLVINDLFTIFNPIPLSMHGPDPKRIVGKQAECWKEHFKTSQLEPNIASWPHPLILYPCLTVMNRIFLGVCWCGTGCVRLLLSCDRIPCGYVINHQTYLYTWHVWGVGRTVGISAALCMYVVTHLYSQSDSRGPPAVKLGINIYLWFVKWVSQQRNLNIVNLLLVCSSAC